MSSKREKLETASKRDKSWAEPTFRKKKFAHTDKRKMLETTSEGTKKLGLPNFKEKGSLCRDNEKS